MDADVVAGPQPPYLCWMGKRFLAPTQSYCPRKGAEEAMGQQSKCPGVGPCIEEVALEHGVIEATQRGPRDTAHGALAASSFLQFLS